MRERRRNAVNAICSIGGIELLFHSVLLLLRSEFAGWEITRQSYIQIQAVILFTIVWFELVITKCGKWQNLIQIITEIVYFLAGGLYFFQNKTHFLESGKALFNNYVVYWNQYYETNYTGYETDGTGMGGILGFIVLAVLCISILFRYVLGMRLFFLLPPIAALTPGLLVNVKPDWTGLSLSFITVAVLYAQPWEKEKIVYVNRRDRKQWMQLAGTLFAVLIAVAAVATAELCFGQSAAEIPVNAEKFVNFQANLETYVKNIRVQDLWASHADTHVDNRTPEYTNREILTIYASEQPQGNLYLADFHSSSYENDQWNDENKEFSKAAEEAGYDSKQIGKLLQQETYQRLKDSESSVTYTLEYHINSVNSYVPYFTDLSGLKKEIQVKADGSVKKKAMLKELCFDGIITNVGLYENDEASEDGVLQWYSTYVNKNCKGSTEEVPALKKYTDRIKDRMGEEDIDPESDEMRISYAYLVQDILAEETSYNLYLDDIPQGTNTIQYFLETGREGYCMHYASAGALLLQELGVPARYVSGYVVKDSMFKKTEKGYQADVPDRNGHAWVEIYLEGLGWVPVDMTPGYGEEDSSLPTYEENQEQLKQQHAQNQEKKKQEQKQETERETQKVSAENGRTDQTKKNTTYHIIWWFVGIIALAAVGFVYLRKRYTRILISDLQQKKNRSAVKRINRRIYRRTAGFSHITDEEFLEKLVWAYPAMLTEDWEKYLRIVQKAVFSKEEITEEEAKFCYGMYLIVKRSVCRSDVP